MPMSTVPIYGYWYEQSRERERERERCLDVPYEP
jgi:hypothetical protein